MEQTNLVFLPLQQKINHIRTVVNTSSECSIKSIHDVSTSIGVFNWITFNDGFIKLSISDVMNKDVILVSVPSKAYSEYENRDKYGNSIALEYCQEDVIKAYKVAYGFDLDKCHVK